MSEFSQSGSIRISDDVVASIAGIAAINTHGVTAMSGGISEGIAKRISGRNVHKGVGVEVGELEAAIDLRVIIQYGLHIQHVCRELQENVKTAVENMTGLKVIEVNVKVEGISMNDETDA